VRTCDLEPFRYQATPQPIGEQGASANQINEQFLEDYLSRLREAVCADLQELQSRITALEARVTALE
jgi:polyhydroxyalkanoate synthesis regulator phasin